MVHSGVVCPAPLDLWRCGAVFSRFSRRFRTAPFEICGERGRFYDGSVPRGAANAAACGDCESAHGACAVFRRGICVARLSSAQAGHTLQPSRSCGFDRCKLGNLACADRCGRLQLRGGAPAARDSCNDCVLRCYRHDRRVPVFKVRSVWPVVLFHAALNGIGLYTASTLFMGRDPNVFIGPDLTGVLGGAGFILAAAFCLAALVRRRKKADEYS